MGFSFHVNAHRGTPGTVVLPASGFRRAAQDIRGWPGYAPTPLRDVSALAAECRVAAVRIKDESSRFGLGSFKALGGPYAVVRAAAAADARGDGAITVTCATDGNHGRAVAWGARRLGLRCVIYVHATVSQRRADAIAAYGAEIRRMPGTYDDAVRACAAAAAEAGWTVVSDTSWPGYTTVPVDVMQGYRLMADEALTQWEDGRPTHVFVQAGVGAAAAAVSVQLRAREAPATVPKLVIVEPDRAACLLQSARAGAIQSVAGELDTIMAGLACGEPSLLAWAELARATFAFIEIPDEAAAEAMRGLAREGIVSGETGAAGLAGLQRVCSDTGAREALGLTEASRVLLFSTEGATDEAIYRTHVGSLADGLLT